jgi:hypothetical protein
VRTMRAGEPANFAALLSRVPGAMHFSSASRLRKQLNKNINSAIPGLA